MGELAMETAERTLRLFGGRQPKPQIPIGQLQTPNPEKQICDTAVRAADLQNSAFDLNYAKSASKFDSPKLR